MTPDLKGIRERMEKATPGPWEWERSYEMADDEGIDRHWALHNPDQPDAGVGDGCSRILNAWLVLATTCATDFDGTPLDQTPDFQFIAHARSDVPDLVREVERKDAEIAELRADAARWRWIRRQLMVWPEETLAGTTHPFLRFRLSPRLPDGTPTSAKPEAVDAAVDAEMSSAPSRDGSPND